MAELVGDDVVEQILIRLDVKDLVRYKRACKSWHSLITSPRFISCHLNRSYNKDRYNNQLGHRRITLFTRPRLTSNPRRLVGSSNGLVCISSPYISSKFIVGNPLTREVRHLELPRGSAYDCMCLGFGYDASRDDYKVIAGYRKGDTKTCVLQMLSLKSNVWRVIGEVKPTLSSMDVGILCNGALHWMITYENLNNVILAYDLSKEEFNIIPQPKVAGFIGCYLGIREECLCIFGYSRHVWLMKKYNVKESWERLRRDRVKKFDIVHILRLGLHKDDDRSWFSHALKHPCWEYMDAPIFVESLVSPQVNASLMLLKQKPRIEGNGEESTHLVSHAEAASQHQHHRTSLSTSPKASAHAEARQRSSSPEQLMVEDLEPSVVMSSLVQEDPGPSASSFLMKEVIVFTFILLLSIILFLFLMFL